MSDLTALIAQRGQIKAQLTRFATYLRTNCGDDVDYDQVKIRADKTRQTWEDFRCVQLQIEEEDGANEENEKYRDEFENLYFESMAKCEKVLKMIDNSGTNASSENIGSNANISVKNDIASSSNPNINSMVKLAALQIPQFSGAYTDWAAFHDIFSALVHKNESLNDIQKFFYLRSSLAGDAESVINCLQTTADNYIVAWNSLIERYDNKKVLIQVHTQAIFDLEPIKKESSSQLRKLVDALAGHMKALESLGERPNQWGSLLMHLIVSKLDTKTMREWEISSSSTEVSRISNLMDFLQSRFRVLEAVETSQQINSLQENNRIATYANKKKRSSAFAATSEIKCYFCKQAHTIYRCPSFLGLTIADRIKRITELRLCKICLRSHEGERCQSRRCTICSRPHNGLLHLSRTDKPTKQFTSRTNEVVDRDDGKEDDNINAPAVSVSAYAYRKNNNSQILLSTATVIAYNVNRKPIQCRVLLDSGSQHNFITEALAQHLRLKRTRTSCAVVGINESTHTASHIVNTTIKSRITDYLSNLDFFILPKLTTNLPSMPITTPNLNIPAGLAMADPAFGTPQAIDMILGAEIFFDLINNEQLRPMEHGPVLQSTKLGWIISGPVPHPTVSCVETSVSLFAHTSFETKTLEEQMAAFWRLEEVKSDESYTIEERACKQHFFKNVQRDDDGRFIVALPFKGELKLGNSYDRALRRFMSLERRLQADKNLKSDYVKFMNQYIELGHMSIANSVNIAANQSYYLPHHAVIKESSTSTKLRVVFDASAKTDTNVSLNDALLKGPCIQEELVSIMARFRTHKYVITADIKKMYRQIWVTESQREYQRILWREEPDQPLNTYRLNTVTYGVITASYLATACLSKLSDDEALRFPEACRALKRDFYVDDFLGGAESISEALKLRDDLITVLQKAGMELCKWSSNDPRLLENVDIATIVSINDNINDIKNTTKILGMYWNKNIDAYQYTVRPFDENTRITKRVILSEIASVFDPLGLISPVIIKFKIIMQQLWQLNTSWDAVLPSNIENEWRDNRLKLNDLNLLVINRSLIGDGEIADIQLHGFSDASETAYGACLYLRVLNTNGKCITNLICSKSRVAPLKTVSIPRLELLAAVLLARLASKYAPNLHLPIKKRFFWSDSMVVLAWISSQSSKWKTFVANRVGEIHERTSIHEWSHVSTHDNPADIVSRGCWPSQIKNLELWWNGPKWLSDSSTKWPIKGTKPITSNEVIKESKTASCVATINNCDKDVIYDRYSSLTKLIRVVAYCKRFIRNALSKYADKYYGPIQANEYDVAVICIIKQIQAIHFDRELSDLQNSRLVHCKSSLRRLKPFLDENSIIRVGGRLKHASTLDVFQRHPIVLPSKCNFTILIFLHEHEVLLHGGPQAMLASVRLKYWPLNGRNIARMIAHQCVKCFKYRPVVVQPIMGDLPKARVEPSRAFSKAGVDFAGPFQVKASLRRNAPTNKAYACIWVCLATKAVHVELVGDLTTQSFLNALQRFCDRRGLCTDIYSDNATNFVGANRRLQEVKKLFLSKEHQNKVNDEIAKHGIQWHFIPPRSPHFGGLWEAAVKSLKTHLYKFLGNASLTFEELNTVLVRIEAILNSRPLTPLSTDPSDMSVLTPGHFLIGDSLRALPDRDETATPLNNLSRWRRVTQLSQHIWSRWSRDYLGQLQARNKWSSSQGPSIQIGTVVLIRDDNLPPLQWSIGRVIDTHFGTDDNVRVATVRTSRGEFKRAVRNLCPLPFNGNNIL